MSRRDSVFAAELVRLGSADGCVPCAYCETRLVREKATLDHVSPRSQNKRRCVEVVIACAPCNNTKSDHPIDVFVTWLKSETGQRWITLGPDRPVYNIVRGRPSRDRVPEPRKRGRYDGAMLFEHLPDGTMVRRR